MKIKCPKQHVHFPKKEDVPCPKIKIHPKNA